MEALRPVRMLPSQRERAVEVVVAAFRDDVGYSYVFPDREERVQSIRRLWSALLWHSLLFGQVYTTPGVHGVAAWLPLRGPSLSLWQLLRTGFAIPRAVLSLRPRGRQRLGDMLAFGDRIHESTVKELHWYLGILAVEPSFQRQGIGGSLLQPILARADEERRPCYLEAVTEGNVRFYGRHGFRVVREGEVPGHPVRMWAMLRPAYR